MLGCKEDWPMGMAIALSVGTTFGAGIFTSISGGGGFGLRADPRFWRFS